MSSCSLFCCLITQSSQTYLRTDLNDILVLMWHQAEVPEPILRCSVHSGGRLGPGTRLDQTQSRRNDAFMWFMLNSDWAQQIYLQFPLVFCSSGGSKWFRSALFTWKNPTLPAGGASGEHYNFNNVTKVRKTGHIVDSSQVFIQNSLKQNVNTVKSTFQSRDGTKKRHKCIYWWGVKYCHHSVEVQGSRGQIQKLGTRIIE